MIWVLELFLISDWMASFFFLICKSYFSNNEPLWKTTDFGTLILKLNETIHFIKVFLHQSCSLIDERSDSSNFLCSEQNLLKFNVIFLLYNDKIGPNSSIWRLSMCLIQLESVNCIEINGIDFIIQLLIDNLNLKMPSG